MKNQPYSNKRIASFFSFLLATPISLVVSEFTHCREKGGKGKSSGLTKAYLVFGEYCNHIIGPDFVVRDQGVGKPSTLILEFRKGQGCVCLVYAIDDSVTRITSTSQTKYVVKGVTRRPS